MIRFGVIDRGKVYIKSVLWLKLRTFRYTPANVVKGGVLFTACPAFVHSIILSLRQHTKVFVE